jgi:serine/threonine-protein kinase
MRTCPTCQRHYIDTQTVCPLDQATLGPSDGATKLAPGLGKELGSYRLISLLGKGGMGSIYIGAHTRINRYVAVKLVRRDLDKRTTNVTRFFDEASTVNRIKHPNVVESLDLVEDVVDGSYCVMELLNGPDLKARIADGPLPLESAVHIGTQIADALSAVHALDIVHRDLKPENLILLERGDRDDFVKLIDFGVAQTTTEPGTGAPVGTPAYMAPEQAAGQRVDGRADVYALGVLLFEMTTGEHPFPSSTDSEYLLRHTDDEPPPPSELRSMPSALETVILRCLAKEPSDRFPTAASVGSALRAIDLDVAAAPRTRSGTAKWVAMALLVVGGAAAVIVPRYLRDAEAIASTSMTLPTLSTTPEPEPIAPEPIAPEPAVPTTVTIEFVSRPAGATVTRAGETVPLGVTPFSAPLVRSDKAGHVRIELAGHVPQEIEVPLTMSHTLAIPMTRVAAVVSKQPAKAAVRKKPEQPEEPRKGDGDKPKPVQREGVMDPFAN